MRYAPSPGTHVDLSRVRDRICTEMLRINLMTEKWLGVQLMDGEVVNAEKNAEIVEVQGALGCKTVGVANLKLSIE